MSTTIDSKVVEMRFDNSHFEKNVSTTMSTLDKLKAKLGFKGATKGLEDVSASAKKVDLSSIGQSADTVGLRFNAMYTIADQALRNITNSAMQAGKNIISALTIDPVKTGLQEYETKIGAIQVIKANTRTKYASEAEQMADIEKTLADLNDYADRTIYNYTQMTDNLGKFVNQGLDLDEAANAVMGLANLAGASGASAQDMARATYQMSQAMGGVIRKMDWNSLRNANMAGTELKGVLMDLARVNDIKIDDMIADKGTFEETLEKGWLTGDLFTKAMNIYSDVYSEAELKAMGFKDAQIENFKALAKTAREATVEVKTASQLWDVLKETAQSGWTQTWEIIVGDFDTAKKMFTGLQVYFSDIINRFSDARNRVLEIALNFTKPWKNVAEVLSKIRGTVSNVTGPISKVGEVVSSIGDKFKNATEAVDYYQKIVRSVWRGNWKHSDTGRYQLLEAAGYDHRVVQDLVNLGSRHKITIEDIERSHKKFGLTLTTTTEETEQTTDALQKLSDEQLRNAGLTEDEISLYNALWSEAERAGVSFDELSKEMSEVSGRDLLIESFKNMWDVVVGIAKALKGAWVDVFNPPSLEVMGVRLYGVIRSLKEFTETIRLTDKETGELNDTGKKLMRAFKGIMAIADVLLTIFGAGFRIVFKIASQVLEFFGMGLLDVAALVGDALVKFHDWFESLFDITGILEVVVPWIQSGAKAVGDWFAAFKASEGMQNAIKYIHDIGAGIRDWWAGLKEAENLPKTIAEGIVNFFSNIPTIVSTVFSNIWTALTGSFSESEGNIFGGIIAKIRSGFSIVGQTFVELGKIILEKINGFLSAHGFEEISFDAIAGLVNGFKSGAVDAWNAAVEMAKGLLEYVKNFLGIHSPSTKFAEIGKFITEGLVVGIKNGANKVWTTIKNLFNTIVNWIKQIDFGAVFSAVIGLGIVRATNKIGDGIAGFGSLAEELGEGIGKVLVNVGRVVKSFSKVLRAIAFEKTANAIKNFAIALAVLVGALVVLAYACGRDDFNVWEAVGVIASLAVVLGILAGAMTLISKASMSIGKDGIKLGGLTNGLVGIGVALLLVAMTVKAVGGMNPEQAKAGFIGLVGIVLTLISLVAAFKFLAAPDTAVTMTAAGATILKISVAMMLLVMVAKSISKMSWGAMGKATVGLLGLIGIITLLMLATKLVGPNANLIGGTILKISIAMGALVLVAKLIAGMSWEDMGKAAIGMLGLVAIVSALMLATKLAGPNPVKIGSTILAISTAMLMLVAVISIVGGMDDTALAKGVGVVVLFAALITGLIAATKLAGANANKAAVTILAVGAAVGILALVAALLGIIKLENLAKGIVAVGLLSSMVALMAYACRGVTDIKGTLIVLVVAVGLMVAAVAGLSLIDPTKLATATASLSALMGMFSLLIFATQFLKTGAKTFQRNLATIAVLTGVVLALAGVIALLSMCNPESVLPTTAALSLLLISLTGAMLILSKVSGKSTTNALKGVLALSAMVVPLALFAAALYFMPDISGAEANVKTLLPVLLAMTALLIPLTLIGTLGSWGALVGVLALTAMVVPLAAFGLALHLLPDVSGAIGNVKLLTQLMTAMTILLIPLSLIGFLSAGAFPGIIALTAMVVPLAAFCVALAILPDVSGAIGNVKLLTQLMTDMTLLLIPLTLIGLLGPAAFVGMAALGTMASFIVKFGVLAAAISGLNKLIPDLQTFLATGIDILAQLASGLGRVVASFITGFAGEVMTILPMLGNSLSAFMVNATPFINGVKMVDERVLTGVGYLAGAILALTAANLLNGIVAFLPWGGSLASLGTQLSLFMSNALPFITTAALITPEMMAGVKSLAETILILTAANVLDGLTSWVTGDNSLERFATQLPILGQGLSAFAASLGTFTEDQLNTVKCAADAVKTLASAAAEIPNTGGLLGSIVGDNDLSTFAAQFPILGAGLALFLSNVGTFTDEQVKTVDCAAAAIKSLAQASSEIPNSGGLLAMFVGENDLSTFAAQFPMLGTGLRGFVDNIGTFSEEQRTTVDCAANAVKTLASVASEIPNEGGFVSVFTGENDLGSFAAHFPKLGTGLRGFVDNIGTFSAAQVSTVSSAVRAIQALTGLANADLKGATKHLSGFGDDLPAFAEDISSFCSKMPSSESTTSAVSNLNKILAAVRSIADANSGALATFATNLKKVGEDAVKKFVDAFTSGSAKEDLKSAAKTLAEKAVSGAKEKKDAMEGAGEDLGDGLVKGIKNKWDDAYSAGYALGQKAVQGEKDGQKSNSPSKLTIQAGQWIGEGLVIGMGKMGGQVYKAGHTLGETATDTISTSIASISKMVSSDIDAQPTIRPVLDLSDVRTGAAALGSMLDMNSSVGVSANVRAISSMMSVRGQNGVNADVVAAIDKLNKRMDNLGNTTYQINGITYDDGSNINDAVATLVRAAKIERRV